MIMQANDPRLISDIIPDSFVGFVCFKWDKNIFKNIMEFLGFQKVINRSDQEIYRKRVKSEYLCSLAAYPNGKIIFNGCHSQVQMEKITLQLKDKLRFFSQTKILLKQNLKIVTYRCKIQYNLLFDIEKLSTYLFELLSEGGNINKRAEFIPERSKIMIPEWIHNIKKLRLFAVRLGYIEIYRANLIPNLEKFARDIYQTLLQRFSCSMIEKIPIYKYEKHEFPIKKPIVKKIVIKNGENLQQVKKIQSKKQSLIKSQQEQFIRYQFQQDFDQQKTPAETKQVI